MNSISIVVPCYNCENTISHTVEHLINQTDSDYEIVMVDDGAEDNTPQLLEDYRKIDPRIRVIHQDNKGLMRAWKNGVIEATGEYILFCDADDYIDDDLIERIKNNIELYQPDLVVYGMIEEYTNAERKKSINKLPEGYYSSDRIKIEILPQLFFDGRMQSELISKSRCNKAFRKELLLKVLDDLPDRISFCEDDLTTFAFVVNSDSIYCLGDYAPYHYVKSAQSMIGRHDPEVFDKIDDVYSEMISLSNKYGYPYTNQILQDQLSTTLLFLKKEIERNPKGRKAVIEVMRNVRESNGFRSCLKICSIRQYSFMSLVFAALFFHGLFSLDYYLVKAFQLVVERPSRR